METFLITLSIGLIVSILGIVNMTGNISSLHRYHRHRVTEENVKPFGKLVGLGTLIVGLSLMIFGALAFISEQIQAVPLIVIGTVELIAGIVVCLSISFYAMIKYNKGIF